MELIKKKAYNHLLTELKDQEHLTNEKLATLANVSIATLNSWLTNPEHKKWRRLNKERFYLIKSRVLFGKDSGSWDQKGNISFYLQNINDALNIAKNSIHSGKSIPQDDLEFIDQALEMSQLIYWSLDDLIPADEKEVEYLNSLENSAN